MSRSEAIALRVGGGRWLNVAQQLVSSLGLVGILCSGARIGWLVAATCAWCVAEAAVGRARRKASNVSALTLRHDGSAVITSSTGTVEALPCAGGWVSRWFCVLTLQLLDNGRRIRLLVCRSVNSADAYRHLLMHRRLGSSAASHGTVRPA